MNAFFNSSSTGNFLRSFFYFSAISLLASSRFGIITFIIILFFFKVSFEFFFSLFSIAAVPKA